MGRYVIDPESQIGDIHYIMSRNFEGSNGRPKLVYISQQSIEQNFSPALFGPSIKDTLAVSIELPQTIPTFLEKFLSEKSELFTFEKLCTYLMWITAMAQLLGVS